MQIKKSQNKSVKDVFSMFGDIDFAQPPSSLSIYNVESLESNRLFRALKAELERFYIERNRPIEKHTYHKTKSQEWKERFYQSMQTLMNELLFTSSGNMKQVLLTKIHKWYVEMTGISPLPEPRRLINDTYNRSEEPEIFILQNIEPTETAKTAKLAPYMPSKLKLSKDDNPSKQSLFRELLDNERDNTFITLPKVKKLRSKDNFFRPFTPMKNSSIEQSPIIRDFRSSSRCQTTGLSMNKSPDIFKSSFLNYSGMRKSPINEMSAVPDLRRIQIKEVMKIKKRLASRRIFCPVKVLEGGLVISDFGLDPVQPEEFPRGGELLMKDPNEPKISLKKKRKRSKKKT